MRLILTSLFGQMTVAPTNVGPTKLEDRLEETIATS